MTEQEAIANLTYRRDCWIGLKYVNNEPEPWISCVLEEAMQKGAEALEEIQQYRKLMQILKKRGTALDILNGECTVDNLLRAMEKQIPKKPVGLKKNICPNCSWGIVMTTQKYCDECGQKLDR